jgi:hypothetical protein
MSSILGQFKHFINTYIYFRVYISDEGHVSEILINQNISTIKATLTRDVVLDVV